MNLHKLETIKKKKLNLSQKKKKKEKIVGQSWSSIYSLIIIWPGFA